MILQSAELSKASAWEAKAVGAATPANAQRASPQSAVQKKARTRRRASKACLTCRARKVRCDVLLQESTCSNCKYDDLECVVVSRKNVRRPYQVLPVGSPSAPSTSSTHAEQARASASLQRMPFASSAATVGYDNNAALSNGKQSGASEQDSAESQRSLGATPSSSTGSPAYDAADWTTSPGGTRLAGRQQDSLMLADDSGQPVLGSAVRPPLDMPHANEKLDLPGFIIPLSTQVPSEDVCYLKSKGALSVPETGLRNALMRSFFDYTHPFMPVVDLYPFLHAVSTPDGSRGQVSLLLFQAIMFAGTAHVDMDQLRKAGFRTRRRARETHFERLRLLYDFNCESDRLVVVQALLLMTLWYGTAEGHRNTWYWTDVAISQAIAAGLHHEPDASTKPREAHHRRRIWWACIVRDRLISMAMRRPLRVSNDEIAVAMLSEYDFDLDDDGDGNGHGHGSRTSRQDLQDMCSYADAGWTSRHLARLCVALAHLCRCMWHQVPAAHFSVFPENGPPGIDVTGASGAVETDMEQGASEFASSRKALAAWYETLLPHCRYQPLATRDVSDGEAGVAVYRAFLHMLFYSMQAGLHRYRYTALLSASTGGGAGGTPTTAAAAAALVRERDLARSRMQYAATQISDTAGDLLNAGLDRLLPTAAITPLVAAAVAHLLIVKGRVHAERRQALEGYRRCMRTLQSLQDMYVAADIARDVMEWAFLDDRPSLIGGPASSAADSFGTDGAGRGVFSPSPPSTSETEVSSLSDIQWRGGGSHSTAAAAAAFEQLAWPTAMDGELVAVVESPPLCSAMDMVADVFPEFDLWVDCSANRSDAADAAILG